MQQVKWLETLSAYDFDIHYYLKKANKVTDVLSRKTYNTHDFMRRLPKELAKVKKELELVIVHGKITNLEIQPIILDDIR